MNDSKTQNMKEKLIIKIKKINLLTKIIYEKNSLSKLR